MCRYRFVQMCSPFAAQVRAVARRGRARALSFRNQQRRLLRVTTGLDPVVRGDSRLTKKDRKVRSSFASAWIAGSSPAMTPPRNHERERREAERRQTRIQPSALSARQRILRDALACRRYRGSSWRCRNTSVQLQARLPGTRHAHDETGFAKLMRHSRHGRHALLGGRSPPLPVPVQWMHPTDRS